MNHSRLVFILLVAAVSWSTVLSAQIPSSFMVSVQPSGMPVMYFQELTNLGSQHEVVEHTVVDGNGNEIVNKVPGRLKWFDITLSRGLTSSMEIWDWRQLVVDENLPAARKDVAVIVVDAGGNPVARWECVRCWPSEIEARVGVDEPAALERLVLACEGIERVAVR